MASPTGQTGLVNFPVQLVIMVSEDVAARILHEAETRHLSKSAVARELIDDGFTYQRRAPTREGISVAEFNKRIKEPARPWDGATAIGPSEP